MYSDYLLRLKVRNLKVQGKGETGGLFHSSHQANRPEWPHVYTEEEEQLFHAVESYTAEIWFIFVVKYIILQPTNIPEYCS